MAPSSSSLQQSDFARIEGAARGVSLQVHERSHSLPPGRDGARGAPQGAWPSSTSGCAMAQMARLYVWG